jgi:hypothetical protein
METLTLVLFVLMLLVASALVTATIRRDFKAREKLEGGRRRERGHAHDAHALHDAHVAHARHPAHERPALPPATAHRPPAHAQTSTQAS